jgi:hypothetical protein
MCVSLKSIAIGIASMTSHNRVSLQGRKDLCHDMDKNMLQIQGMKCSQIKAPRVVVVLEINQRIYFVVCLKFEPCDI